MKDPPLSLGNNKLRARGILSGKACIIFVTSTPFFAKKSAQECLSPHMLNLQSSNFCRNHPDFANHLQISPWNLNITIYAVNCKLRVSKQNNSAVTSLNGPLQSISNASQFMSVFIDGPYRP